jgi:ATP-dependent Clp protease ATP-binding subunit ClpX
MVDVDTSKILFIVGGAFIGLDKIVNDRKHKGGIGFGVDIKDPSKEEDFGGVEPEDLIKFGFIPEFVGRFGLITYVKELTKDQLVSIMKEPKNAMIKQYKYLFGLDGADLEFTKEAMVLIAEKAKEMKTNARGIKNIIEKILLHWQFNAHELVQKGLTSITINKEAVEDPKRAILVYKEEENGKTN